MKISTYLAYQYLKLQPQFGRPQPVKAATKHRLDFDRLKANNWPELTLFQPEGKYLQSAARMHHPVLSVNVKRMYRPLEKISDLC